jgi:signal peptidase I
MLGPASKSTLLVGLVLGGVGLSAPVKLGVVCGHSMQPALQPGALYLLDRHYYRQHAIAEGDVVVFNQGGKTYVKRVLARGGDTVFLHRYRGDEGYQLTHPDQVDGLRRLTTRKPWRGSLQVIARRIPEGELFVIGDNLQDSVDSRDFGPVPVEAVQGRVLGAPAAQPELKQFAQLPPARG